jgi:hypothetical protein
MRKSLSTYNVSTNAAGLGTTNDVTSGDDYTPLSAQQQTS